MIKNYYADHQSLQYASIEGSEEGNMIELFSLQNFTYSKEPYSVSKHAELLDGMKSLEEEKYKAVRDRFNQIVHQTANMGNQMLNQIKYGELFVDTSFKVNLRDIILNIDKYLPIGQTYSTQGIASAHSMLFKDLYEERGGGRELFFKTEGSLAYINPQKRLFRLFDLSKKKVYPQVLKDENQEDDLINKWKAHRTSRDVFHALVRSSGFIASGCKVMYLPTNEVALVLGVNTKIQKVALGGYPALVADLKDCEFYDVRRQLTKRELEQRKVLYKGHWNG